MKTWIVSPCYMRLSIIEKSLAAFYETVDEKWETPYEHILLDHHWPLDYWDHRHQILRLAHVYGCRVMSPYKNLGGHGGFNWVCSQLPLGDNDLVLGFDPDSFPATKGWNNAMIRALRDDAGYAGVSLWIEADLYTKKWKDLPSSSGLRVVAPADRETEMINISIWRWSFLRRIQGYRSRNAFYGDVEVELTKSYKETGLRHGYLRDFKEVERLTRLPDHGEPSYVEWKAAHVSGKFPGNYDAYLKERGLL